MLKKTTFALLSLVFTSFATAGSMGTACTPGSVTVPCEENKWDLGIQALYLKPTYSSSLGYAPAASTVPVQNIDPDWNWGYRLTGSYHFHTGNDVTLDWSHYDHNSSLGTYLGDYFQLPAGTVAANYQLYLDNKYDQVNLVMGQHVDFGLFKNARFYGGLQYADLRVDNTSYYTITSPVFLEITGGGASSLINTDFSGVGPVLGIDYSYDLTPRVSITANTAGSLVYGTSRYSFATVYGNGLVASSFYGSKKILVPSFEAKLGANYAYEIAHGMLNLEGGYQVVNYLDALQARPFNTTAIVSSNFGLFGPYFGLKWLGNA